MEHGSKQEWDQEGGVREREGEGGKRGERESEATAAHQKALHLHLQAGT